MTPFFKGPIIEILVINKIGETARKEMFGNELCRLSVIVENPGKLQMRPAETEIDCRFFGADDKLRQIISLRQPSKDAISIPPPRNNPLLRYLWRQVPTVLLGVFFDTALKPVIIPAKHKENPSLTLSHLITMSLWMFFFKRRGVGRGPTKGGGSGCFLAEAPFRLLDGNCTFGDIVWATFRSPFERPPKNC